MSELVTVGPLSDLPPVDGHLFRSGPHQIAVFRRGESVYAIDNICPHAGASLAFGYAEEETVTCPWHCWEFEIATGKGLTAEGVDLQTFEVLIEEGVVKLLVPTEGV